ncbi:hypothetical protein RJ639_005650 [Escallonia herrerae]|uniref:S-protein homolog n=1 Tax=Escallonia herrerae TaxID=1293975 RepID=A0AA89AVC8_9ASTE|nr:hypothetical protein RJ639_005650 [Escallonia herrerae]
MLKWNCADGAVGLGLGLLSQMSWLNVGEAYTQGVQNKFMLQQKFEVHVINGILDDPNPVHVHCKSKDDDLRIHDLRANDDLLWKFGLNFFRGFDDHGYKNVTEVEYFITAPKQREHKVLVRWDM